MWPGSCSILFFFLCLSFLLLFHRGFPRGSIFILVIGRERLLDWTADTCEDVTRLGRLRKWMEAKKGQMTWAGSHAHNKGSNIAVY